MIVEAPLVARSHLLHALQCLSNELADFRDRVLPRLLKVDGPEFVAFESVASVMAEHCHHLCRFAGRVNDLSDIDDQLYSAPTCEVVHQAIASAHASQHRSAQMHLLCRRPVSAEELQACRWDGRRIVWSLSAMVMPWPAKVLDDRSREIAQWLGFDAKSKECK